MPKSPERRENSQNRIMRDNGLLTVAFGRNVVTSKEDTGERVYASRGFDADSQPLRRAHAFNLTRAEQAAAETANKDKDFSEKFDIDNPKG